MEKVKPSIAERVNSARPKEDKEEGWRGNKKEEADKEMRTKMKVIFLRAEKKNPFF